MRQNYIEQFDDWKNGFSFSVPVQVRFSETDMNGHLSNTVPAVYFEYARIEFIKQLGIGDDWLSPGSDVMTVVADIQIDFVRQVYFDELLDIHVKVASIGKSSADIHYWTVNQDGETCLTGRGALVQVSKTTGKSVPWSEVERELFAEKILLKANQR